MKRVSVNCPRLHDWLLKVYYSRRALHYLHRGHLLRSLIVQGYLSTHEQRNLQIGGGKHTIEGWLNGDIVAGDIYLDATRKLPFPDSCLDYIFTEHFFEHLSYEAGLRLLREAYRVLKPGGVIRQTTPSLNGLINIYHDQNEVVSQQVAIQRHVVRFRCSDSGFNACRFLNDSFRLWGHQFIYDQETLADVHQKVGFVNIQWKSFGESNHQPLQNREHHADVDWMKSAYVIICEAEKPRSI